MANYSYSLDIGKDLEKDLDKKPLKEVVNETNNIQKESEKMNFNESLKQATESIQKAERKKAVIVQKIQALRSKKLPESLGILEKELFAKAKPTVLNERIAGVDSGFNGQELFATDLLLVRAIAAVFDYKANILQNSSYHPSGFFFPEPFFSTNALERDEFQCNVSIQRIIREVQTAIETIKNSSPHTASWMVHSCPSMQTSLAQTLKSRKALI